MRLRTKLFLTWAAMMLVLWAGAFWTIHRSVMQRIEQMAQDAFEGTRRGLEGIQAERIERMQQAGRLVMSIPELRELIARVPAEIDAKYRESLQERIDALAQTARVSFIVVLSRGGRGIAQSAGSPWPGADECDQYIEGTAQPMALLRRAFAPVAGRADSQALLGLWPYAGKLYQVVAVPLVFQEDEPDGALLLGEPISDETAAALGASHNSHITFFNNGGIVASSLPRELRLQLTELLRRGAHSLARFELGNTYFHASIQPLTDPASGSTVGQMLVQSDQQDTVVEASILKSLVLIMVSGLALAAAASFGISSAITHPVRRLVAGVQQVAHGDLDLTLPIKRHDELGELSASFNDMVSQLRSRAGLEKKVQEVESASRAKSQFLANMSHEIRTPLNGVIGMTELLMGTPLTDQQRRFAALVKTSAELLTTQINDILDFSKIEAGKLEIESIEFDLHHTVEAVVELLSEKASKKKLELACHFLSDVPRTVRGDPARLRQILVNLLNNAIKFTSAGSIVVRVSPHAQIHEQSMVRVTVTDTGIGIPPDRLDRLFRPFSQVDASTTRKYGGTGLGLAIAKQLAELMGGAIGVESMPNHGSTFWFTVRLENVSEGQPIPAAQGPLDRESLSVLAVDDSQTTLGIMEEQLASWGLRAKTCANAAEALGILRRAADAGQPYTVAIIDSDMPGTNGFELARAIKADSSLRETTLMALLPIEAPVSGSQLKETGFSGHMTKPVRQSQLLDNIMRAVAREHADSLRGQTPLPQESNDQHPNAAAPAAPAILIAEDNEVNQIVVVELLSRQGYRCHVVDNGLKAVEAAMSGAYGLVLMDCQMPEMDGFQASRLIRQKEASAGNRRIPIIALTANAIKGDREQCLDAGMDGYCSKPIDSRQLLGQIGELLKQQSPPVADEQPVCTEKSTAIPPIMIDTLVQRCMNNLNMVGLVVQKFEKQAQGAVEQIARELTGGDLDAATRSAHSLKGAAAIVAADALSTIAGKIERLGRQQEVEEMQQQLSTLEEEVRRCIEYLPQVRSILASRLSSETRDGIEV